MRSSKLLRLYIHWDYVITESDIAYNCLDITHVFLPPEMEILPIGQLVFVKDLPRNIINQVRNPIICGQIVDKYSGCFDLSAPSEVEILHESISDRLIREGEDQFGFTFRDVYGYN